MSLMLDHLGGVLARQAQHRRTAVGRLVGGHRHPAAARHRAQACIVLGAAGCSKRTGTMPARADGRSRLNDCAGE